VSEPAAATGAAAPGLRAVVLAAGRGERLRPLTDRLPKPLLPVAGRSVLEHTLAELAGVGCREVAINLWHRGEDIRRHLGERWGGLTLTYSREPSLLGTLGAFGPLAGFVAAADPLLVINGDSLCPWPLRRLLREQAASGAAATLLLARHADPRRYGGGVAVDATGRILGLRGEVPAGRGVEAHRRVFAGAHVLSPALVAWALGRGLATRPFRAADFVGDLYEPLLAGGWSASGSGGREATGAPRPELASVTMGQRWHDLGTPERYLEGVLDWVQGNRLGRVGAASWIAERTQVAPAARVEQAAIEAGVEVAPNAYVGRAVLLAGARVGEAAQLREVVVGPGAEIPPGARFDRCLVVAATTAEDPLPAGSRRTGTLVVTPFS
jgi:NDP-sugar pyrophosphorylase family protein